MIERPLGSTRKISRYMPEDIFPCLHGNRKAPNQQEFDWVRSYANMWDWLVQIETDYLHIMAEAAKEDEELRESLGYKRKEEYHRQIDRAVTLFETKIYKGEIKGTPEIMKKFSDLLKLDGKEEEELDKFARELYGWIHARYILTVPGLIKMANKFHSGIFGCCPRINCKKHPVLPIGRSDILGQDLVKVFCPLCHDIYEVAEPIRPEQNRESSGVSVMPWGAIRELDGAYFGTSFVGVFMTTFPEFCMEEANVLPKSSYTECMPLDIYTVTVSVGGQVEDLDEMYSLKIKKENLHLSNEDVKEVLKFWRLSVLSLTDHDQWKQNKEKEYKLVVYLPHDLNMKSRLFQETVKSVVVNGQKDECAYTVNVKEKLRFRRRSVMLREPD